MKFVTDLSKGVLGKADSTELWEDIISHIPDSVLQKPNVRILCVACGHGTTAIVLAKRMLALGISKEAVNDSLYLLDKYIVFTNPVKKVYGFKHVITADFLTWETDMKFDVIVGNPPFSGNKTEIKGTRANQLYVQFINKSLKMGKFVGMVLPALWTHKPGTVKKELHEFGLVKCKSCNSFFSIEVDTCYIIAEKGYTGELTIVSENNDTYSTLWKKNDPIHLNSPIIGITVLDKTSREDNLSKLWARSSVNRNDSKFGKGKTQVVDITGSDNEELVILRTSLGETYFPGYQDWKVITNNVGRTNRTLGVTKIVKPGYGTTYSVISLIVKSESEACALNLYINSKLVRFIINCVKNSGVNSKILFSHIPKVDLTRTWTDTELYAHFNLTQEEIDYIEANVK